MQNKKNITNLTKSFVAVVVIAGTFLSTVSIMPPLVGRNLNTPILLDFDNSIKIASKSLSSGFKNAAIGFGPENFVNAFSLLKPKSMNTSEFWIFRFTSSKTFFFQMISTLGLLGTLSFIILTAKIIFKFPKYYKSKNPYFFSALLIILMQLLIPYSITLFFLLFITIALSEENPATIKTNFAFSFVSLIPAIIIFIVSSQFLTNIVSADYLFYQSIINQPPITKNTLDLQRKAVELNPYNSEYFTNLSQNSYVIGQSVIQKENPSAEEEQRSQTYIEESIKYIQKAIQLNPDLSTNYAIIASVYRNNFDKIKDGDKLSMENYEKAIALDPSNPRTYVDYGSLYYKIENFKKAEENLRKAIELKPDYTNAYYNLAYALAQEKNYKEALAMIDKVLALLPQQGPDYEKALSDKESLTKSLLPSPAATPKLAELIDAGISSTSGKQRKILKINTEELLKIATASAD